MVLTSLAVLAAATPGFTQDETARRAATEIAARVPLEKATTGAPYSADTLIEGVQVLADGNRIVRKTAGRVYRDSEGRTRREDEQPFTVSRNGDMAVRRSISIVDPVAGFSYSLDPERKIAWRTPMGVASGIMDKIEERAIVRKVEPVTTTTPDGTTVVVERTRAELEKVQAERSAVARGGGGGGGGGGGRARGVAVTPDTPLEHKTLEGIAVEGRKTTRIIAAGQVGNEQPLTITSEEWRSTELGVLVMTRHSDPRTGESTYRLTNILRAEPDRSLFMIPSDFEVRDTGVRRMLEAQRK
jgi:hypothetical protein